MNNKIIKITLLVFILLSVLHIFPSYSQPDKPIILIIFDFSSNMAVKEDDDFRYEIALNLLKKINFSQFDSKFGLLVFGADGKENGNEDISIIVKPDLNVEKEILAQLNILLPYGESPLAQALNKSREILTKNKNNFIILPRYKSAIF